MKSIKYYSIVLILLLLVFLNFIFLKANLKSKNINNKEIVFNYGDFKVISNNCGKLYNKRIIFIYDITACSACIETMYSIISKLSEKKEISIDVIIADHNFQEIKAFCDSNYSDLYNSVAFYQVDFIISKETKDY